ncbi:Bacteriochlorophyll synthase [Caenispirillum salinarum AK4]|uniref:Bacteriochlorophyll synthase n=1 Tax=Caenispirillum salinarum AK4 TaxID=1238182 RepID=K9HRF0_9PROT|nr:BCD family MFS transporter [Caenispirillum salinarum]EKV32868.1 Bacteriochlorophyll synthase [Caenispirillum salinarum AK4]
MSTTATPASLGWGGILRLGLVQTALGAIVVLTTSTLNRVMVVELALPAMLPGALVALHYGLQFLRPRWGHGSDVGGRRTPWIIGGMAVLGLGAVTASAAVAWMGSNNAAGVALAVAGFVLIGMGVGAAGTSLLALLATRVDPARRAPAATLVWMMMILGFAVTAGAVGAHLDPYTPARLVAVTAVVSAVALLVTLSAVWRIEGPSVRRPDEARKPAFAQAFRAVWGEGETRRFAVFVFVSMLAYSLQDLILEPFAGTVFAMTPGQSTSLAGVQHGGVFVGMVLVGLAGWRGRGRAVGSLKLWTVGGCLASAGALGLLAFGGIAGPRWPLEATVAALGVSNGAFAVAAIGSMMALAGAGGPGCEGMRMGVWGAAQAVAFGLGGFLGTAAVDAARAVLVDPAVAYGLVFSAEALLFLAAAALAARPALGARAVPKPAGGLAMLDAGGGR